MKDSTASNPSSSSHGRGLPLGTLNYLMAVFALIISILLLFAASRAANGYRALRGTTDNYIKWQQSIQEMLSAMDYLSEQVRYFTMTGSLNYLEQYFEEYSVVRRRETALEAMREDLEGTPAYDNLKAAMQQSQSLCARDFYAMKLVVAAYGYDLASMPEEVRLAMLLPEDDALFPAHKLSRAQAIVLDSSYLSKKDTLTSAIQQCFVELGNDTEAFQADASDELNELLVTQQVLIVLIIVIVLLIVLMISLLAIDPLLRSVLHIRAEQPIPIGGAAEFRFLAKAYNMMYEETREKTEALAYEAHHDKLTGLYNRAGYDFLLKNADLDTSALLLIDVDKFKSVNDTYGHDVGDRVLRRIADILKECFRSDDFICRIGGDEFAAIMVRSGPQFTDLIRGKVERINDKLQHPQDGLPPSSVSVGVAFGSAEHSTGSIVKDADLALYEVKENGRCGVAFYK